jgi:hypothetical protein
MSGNSSVFPEQKWWIGPERFRGRCLLFAASPPNFDIELATGRVRPKADKGLLDPP